MGDGAVRTASRGLTAAQAAERLERDGPNSLPRRPPTPLWRRITVQLKDPLVVVLLVAAVLTLLTGDYTDTIVILLVVTANTAVGEATNVDNPKAAHDTRRSGWLARLLRGR